MISNFNIIIIIIIFINSSSEYCINNNNFIIEKNKIQYKGELYCENNNTGYLKTKNSNFIINFLNNEMNSLSDKICIRNDNNLCTRPDSIPINNATINLTFFKIKKIIQVESGYKVILPDEKSICLNLQKLSTNTNIITNCNYIYYISDIDCSFNFEDCINSNKCTNHCIYVKEVIIGDNIDII
jgi:hypothetical protein